MKLWQDIPGWFDDADVFEHAVRALPSGKRPVVVEVGAWVGRSTACLCEIIAANPPAVDHYVVDTWEGTLNEAKHAELIKELKKPLFEVFIANMFNAGHLPFIRPIQMPSLSAASLFPARFIDFCYIDADHSFQAVKNDLNAWYPKMAKNGLLAGHDYGWGEVALAVDLFARENGLKVESQQASWKIQL